MPLAGHDDYQHCHYAVNPFISTPMPLAGHDGSYAIKFYPVVDFYSHAPRGA